MLRGETIDQVKMAGRIGVLNNAAERKKLVSDEDAPGVDAISDDQASDRPFGDSTSKLSMKAPMLVSKPADLR